MKSRNKAVLGATLLVTSGLLAGPTTGMGTAASHVDAPRLILDPQMDGSDLYAFVCPEDAEMVCIVTDYAPAQQGSGTPFATDARYEVHVDQHGTGTADLTYRWTFGAPVGAAQPYKLEELRPGQKTKTLVANGTAPLARTGVGPVRAQAVAALPGGGRTLAAKAADSFFTNGKVVGMALTGNALIPNIDLIVALNGNVNAMVLMVPKKSLALGGDVARNPVVGIWATAGRKALDGDSYPQLSRMGNPATDVMTLFSMGEQYNRMKPTEDRGNARFTGFFTNPVAPRLIKAQNWGVKLPATPRADLWQVYMTGIGGNNGPIEGDLNAHTLNRDIDPARVIPCDELRINLGIAPSVRPNRFGLVEDDRQGFPNGRRIGDDIHGTTLRMLLGEPAGAGNPSVIVEQLDKVTRPAVDVSPTFPFLATPH
ncbi:DUF4331 domain-containing protein [Nonomuraea sp. NPDC050556]|uniref:DUF4331 domain-containing protein n=1 Tax=Nonomuraea sp. NPDC050556 TaxID=3364369 RepID=UPI0037A268B0